ncbi:hypothetical protein CL617_04175 [archaeon]|nr:hypothetical protein [archaeon]|tara:strand:- start:6454 stop:7281 length:828 start_codon:yes stop_codon:yes gene_type:complete
MNLKKLNISKVEFSKKDVKNNLKIPKILNNKLAYLIGVHVGDGSMGIYKKGANYYISYTGHIIDEQEYHKEIIKDLFKELFNKRVKINFDRRIKNSSLRTYLNSKAILTFFHKSLRLPMGMKKDIDIPKIITYSNKTIMKYFLRGLADTDFCLTFKKRYKKKHYYPSISFNNQSKYLTKSVINILKKFNINSSVSYNMKSKRNNRINISHQININGKENLSKWMKKIGFNSAKHLTKYQVWKTFGYCPPNTNINERYRILKQNNKNVYKTSKISL